ncbi:hypothetical protein Y032_0022g576 [Ancylostoma ceylanicum]|uniref:Uncharacterized protein n=1 Tax=Ancylostoma ceylanicum TaxID=53326 RepID=A0A016UYR2_9BILA|nr:hypothetical protein Y032_0022g576 [Ancylostoma ceylanicum]
MHISPRLSPIPDHPRPGGIPGRDGRGKLVCTSPGMPSWRNSPTNLRWSDDFTYSSSLISSPSPLGMLGERYAYGSRLDCAYDVVVFVQKFGFVKDMIHVCIQTVVSMRVPTFVTRPHSFQKNLYLDLLTLSQKNSNELIVSTHEKPRQLEKLQHAKVSGKEMRTTRAHYLVASDTRVYLI